MPEKNYTDADLRKISTYMMGSDDFNTEEFSESVDHIMVMTDGSLKYVFKDGRVKTWQRR